MTVIIISIIIVSMIVSFACKKTKKLFNEDVAEGFLKAIATRAKEKLELLHFAASVDDLRIPPGNRLEALKGSRNGQYSIRVNDKYRICFMFENGSAYNVEITDYHR